MSDNPLAQITEGLTKPVSKVAIALIDKIASAGFILYEPIHIKRIAKANAKADKIQAKSQIEIADMHQQAALQAKAETAEIEAKPQIEMTDTHRRAMHRWIEEEARHQKRMEDTTTKTILQLNEDANPNAIEDDWIAKFFDKCRLISDDKMQDLWASILAGEANRAGSFSSKALTTVADMDHNAVKLFNTFCSLCIIDLGDSTRQPRSNFKIRDARVPIITGSNTYSGIFQYGVGESAQKSVALYKSYGFGNDEFQLLLEHGLIQDVNTHTEYSSFMYDGNFWGFTKRSSTEEEFQPLRISGYSLSSVGKELFHITKRSNRPEYFKRLIDFLQECYDVSINPALF